MRHVSLTSIRFDSATQVRAEINNQSVIDYADQMQSGAKFPPADLFEEGDEFYIGDGWHRLLAAQKNGDVTFPCEIHTGGRREAIKFALSANAKHGMPRTIADKQKAVEVALREFPDLSDREIGRICAVSHPMVGRYRETNWKSVPVESRLGADGKIRKVPMRHEPRGEVERAPAEERPPIGGSIEDIEQTARESAREPKKPTTIASNALQYSAMAISALSKIEEADPRRDEAFAEVTSWIGRHQ